MTANPVITNNDTIEGRFSMILDELKKCKVRIINSTNYSDKLRNDCDKRQKSLEQQLRRGGKQTSYILINTNCGNLTRSGREFTIFFGVLNHSNNKQKELDELVLTLKLLFEMNGFTVLRIDRRNNRMVTNIPK